MLCDKLALLLDGELPADEAAAVRRHLPECPRCRHELHGLMQLEALGMTLARDLRRDAGRPASLRRGRGNRGRGSQVGSLPSRPVRRLCTLVAPVVCAAVVVVVFTYRAYRHGCEVPSVVAVAGATSLPGLKPYRSIAGRLSYAGADQYRPYEVQRAGGPAGVEHVPLAVLAELEAPPRDVQGLVAAHILMDSRSQAAMELAELRQTPALAAAAESDRALLALLDQEPETALDILEPVLEREPRHPQALWNRALALEHLGLELLAAQTFDQVAMLGEPGWHEEARTRATRLRQRAEERKQKWGKIAKLAREWVLSGTGFSPAEIADLPGLARLYFYDRVRSTASPEQLDTLRPFARALDEHYGGDLLTAYLERVAQSDLARRAPLARAYAEMMALRRRTDGELPTAEQGRALLARARSAGADAADIQLGLMRYTGIQNKELMVARELLPEYHTLAEQTGDPWHILLAAEEEAQVLLQHEELAAAESALVPMLPMCEGSTLDHRCIRLDYWLGHVYVMQNRVSDARRHLTRSWMRARTSNDWGAEPFILHELSEVAYRNNDSGTGSIAVALAYVDEYALRDASCTARDYQHDIRAVMRVVQNQLAAAREELVRAEVARAVARFWEDVPCERPRLDLQTAFVRAYLLGREGSEAEMAALREELGGLRSSPGITPGELAFADFIEGRLLIERDRQAAHALLRAAIQRADAQPAGDVTAQKARSHSYVLLILDAGAHGEHERALALLAEEIGVAVPERCAVGLAAEHEVLAVARGANGAFAASRQPIAPARAEPGPVIPAGLLAGLAGCDVVDVFARSPYYGSARLLPAELAWRFRSQRAARVSPGLPPRRVVVADVEPPADLRLPLLHSYPADPEAVMIRGADATPARVLAALPGATEIEIHSHGLIDPDLADASFLALSRDKDGKYMLTADEIRAQTLTGAPLVILGACHGAYTTRVFHNPSSLASAFIQAGARTVIASPAPILDADANALFSRLRRRIAAGERAAAVLRDERLQGTSGARRAWIDEIVIFE